MTERTSFYRKLVYVVGIIILAYPIYWLSRPPGTDEVNEINARKGVNRKVDWEEGAVLSQFRTLDGLAQVNLGDVDPASETIKLATLGLRGVAVNLLWEKANYYKKVEDWTNLTATLEQLAKLQPNFITFWKFQAWNLTYNVSVEFDDYHDRYYYVRRGIEFLQEGEHYNTNNPQLLWDLGWFVGQKIGRADEYVQYRRLFKADEDFHPADRKPDDRDNWLVGKEWYKVAIDAVDKKGKSLGRKSPRDFYSSPSKSQMNYAEAIEEDGFWEKARRAWQKAGEEWAVFGEQMIEHSTGVKLYLGSQKKLEKQVADLRAKLNALAPDVSKRIAAEKRKSLKPEELNLVLTPTAALKPEQAQKRAEIEAKIVVSDRDVADRIAKDQPAKANEALQLASDINREDTQLQFTINYKHDANYDYWQNRAEFEQTDDALKAREFMFLGKKEFKGGNIVGAKDLYKQGFDRWKVLIDKFPMILDDEQTTGGDIVDFIKGYRRVLDQFDERLGDDFPLWKVLENFDREGDFTEDVAAHRKRKGLPPLLGAPAVPAEKAAPPKAAAKDTKDAKNVKETKDSSTKAPPSAPAKAPADSTKK